MISQLASEVSLCTSTSHGHHSDGSNMLTWCILLLFKILQWLSHCWHTFAWCTKLFISCLPISPASLYHFYLVHYTLVKSNCLWFPLYVMWLHTDMPLLIVGVWPEPSSPPSPCHIYWITSSQSSRLTQVSFPPRRLNSIPSMGEEPHFWVPIATSIMVLITLYKKVPFLPIHVISLRDHKLVT